MTRLQPSFPAPTWFFSLDGWGGRTYIESIVGEPISFHQTLFRCLGVLTKSNLILQIEKLRQRVRQGHDQHHIGNIIFTSILNLKATPGTFAALYSFILDTRADLRVNHELILWGHFLRMSQCVKFLLPLCHLTVTGLCTGHCY